MNEMKALVYEEYGKAESVVKLMQLPEPEPGPGEVKVRMLYSPVNPSDIFNTIEGTYRNAMGRAIWNYGKEQTQFSADPEGMFPLQSLPNVPGLEGVGIVVKAGAGLYPKFLVGKRVVVVGGKRGNWQEFNVVNVKQALAVRKDISDEQAAMSFVNPVTAYAMICEVLRVKKGEFVLQSAANSELGKMVIKMGKKYGYKTINLIRNAQQEKGLKDLGADFVIDISTSDIRKEVFKITDGKGVPFAIDPISGSLASEMVLCLGLNGRMLVYGTLSSDPVSFTSRDLMTPMAKIEGFFLSNWMLQKSIVEKISIIRKVSKLVADGTLQSTVHKVFKLDEYEKAFETVKEAGNKGKVLFNISAD